MDRSAPYLTVAIEIGDRRVVAVGQRIAVGMGGRIRITLSMAFTTLHHPADVDADLLLHRLEDRLAQPNTASPIPGFGRVVALDEDPAAA